MQNNRLYRNFLILEFGALAVLIASLFWIGSLAQDGQSLNIGHRLLPVIASGLTLTGFLGCMYVRWLRAAEAFSQPRRMLFIFFWLLVVSLFSIWLIAAGQWMMNSTAISGMS